MKNFIRYEKTGKEYYLPTIEDIRVGLKYSLVNEQAGDIISENIITSTIEYLDCILYFEKELVLIKKLDKDDIESVMDFKYDEDLLNNNFGEWKHEVYVSKKYTFSRSLETNYIEIHDNESEKLILSGELEIADLEQFKMIIKMIEQ